MWVGGWAGGVSDVMLFGEQRGGVVMVRVMNQERSWLDWKETDNRNHRTLLVDGRKRSEQRRPTPKKTKKL